MITPKNAIGSQVSRSIWIRAQSMENATTSRVLIGSRTQPSLKRGDDVVGGRELDAAPRARPRAGGRRAPRRARARRPRRSATRRPRREEAADRRVVADVGRDPEDDDLVRVERVEQRLGVRVREDVEVLLQEQDLAAAVDQARDSPGGNGTERERQRVVLLGLGDLLRRRGCRAGSAAGRCSRSPARPRSRDRSARGRRPRRRGRCRPRAPPRRAAPSPGSSPRRPGRRACRPAA